MMYQSDFVLALLHEGSPVREINGTASLPFGSEYKIRLKNKSYVRAKARVWVDGRKASNLGDFILSAGETLDLERFLDVSMETGNRFKVVPLSDGRVNDPTDPQNGIVKVEFFREKAHYTLTSKITNDWRPWPNPADVTGPRWNTNPSYTSIYLNDGNVNTTCYSSLNYCSPIASSKGAPAATVEGSLSNQNFVVGDHFETELIPVVLTLRITGIEYQGSPKVDVGSVEKERFCGGCGKRRHKMSDKFCPRCGNKYSSVR